MESSDIGLRSDRSPRNWFGRSWANICWFLTEPNPWNSDEVYELGRWYAEIFRSNTPLPYEDDFSSKDLADNAKLVFTHIDQRNQHLDRLAEWMLTIPGLITGLLLNNVGRNGQDSNSYLVMALIAFGISIYILVRTRLTTRSFFGIDSRMLLADNRAGHDAWQIVAASWHVAARQCRQLTFWKRCRCLVASYFILGGTVLAAVSFIFN